LTAKVCFSLLDSQGQKLSLTVLYVPHSLSIAALILSRRKIWPSKPTRPRTLQ
jgi:hypothetical protein